MQYNAGSFRQNSVMMVTRSVTRLAAISLRGAGGAEEVRETGAKELYDGTLFPAV